MSNTGGRAKASGGRCPCAGVTLDRLIQPAILTILAREEVHGYRIIQDIASLPLFRDEEPDVSGVYRALRGLERRGLVSASWGPSDRGPARRLYKLTGEGRDCLARWCETLDQYRKAIGALLARARRR